MTIERVDAAAAQQLMTDEDYVYLDVRPEAEFALGHPQGAFNIPYTLGPEDGAGINGDFMRVVRRSFARDQKLLVGCRCGVNSLTAARRLAAAGYVVAEVRPGFAGIRDPFGRVVEPGWEAAKLPCAFCPEAGHDYASLSGE